MARHRDTPLDAPAGQRLLGLPWIGLVLATLVALAALLLLRPDSYAATSRVEAADARSAATAAVDLTRLELLPRVEQEIELDAAWQGTVRLSVDHPLDRDEVLVTAVAPDPRLAALAADTAAALVVSEDPGALTLADPAPVPTRPLAAVPWWGWALAGLLVVAATVLDGRQRSRMLRRRAREIVAGSSSDLRGMAT